MKGIANKYVIDSKAAMSMTSKRRILTQMCLRVLLNNSEYLAWEERKRTVDFFMKRMQASGYSKKFRYEVLKSALKAYQDIKSDTNRPIYRCKELNTAERRQESRKKKRKWFKKGGCESVLFVQATPHSELKRLIQDQLRAMCRSR